MKSATAILLLVLVGSVLVAGQRSSSCPLNSFWQGFARARVQALLTMFPDLADEIRNGQLGPNNRGNNQNNQQPSNFFGNGQPNNRQPSNNLNDNQGGSLLNNLNRGNLPNNLNGLQGNLPNNLNGLPSNNNNLNGQQGGLLDALPNLNNQLPNNLATTTPAFV